MKFISDVGVVEDVVYPPMCKKMIVRYLWKSSHYLWIFCLPLLIIYLVETINMLLNVTWLWMCICSMAQMAQVYLLQAWDLGYFPCWQLWWGKTGDCGGVLQRFLGTKICLWIIRYRFIFNYKQHKFVENDKKSVLNQAPGPFIGT